MLKQNRTQRRKRSRNGGVAVLIFSTHPSLGTYSVWRHPSEAIQRVMMWGKHSLEPLMTQLRNTRERLLAIGTEHLNAKQVKALAIQKQAAGKADRRERRMQSRFSTFSARTAKEAQRISTNAGRTHMGGKMKERLL